MRGYDVRSGQGRRDPLAAAGREAAGGATGRGTDPSRANRRFPLAAQGGRRAGRVERLEAPLPATGRGRLGAACQGASAPRRRRVAAGPVAADVPVSRHLSQRLDQHAVAGGLRRRRQGGPLRGHARPVGEHQGHRGGEPAGGAGRDAGLRAPGGQHGRGRQRLRAERRGRLAASARRLVRRRGDLPRLGPPLGPLVSAAGARGPHGHAPLDAGAVGLGPDRRGARRVCRPGQGVPEVPRRAGRLPLVQLAPDPLRQRLPALLPGQAGVRRGGPRPPGVGRVRDALHQRPAMGHARPGPRRLRVHPPGLAGRCQG